MRFAHQQSHPETDHCTLRNAQQIRHPIRPTAMTSPWVAGRISLLRKGLAMCNRLMNGNMLADLQEILTMT